MTLKYKLGDVVVLGENVETYKGFLPGVKVRIGELCNPGTDREHYSIYPLGSKDGQWWVKDDEINHEATEELQESNETGDIVGKTEAQVRAAYCDQIYAVLCKAERKNNRSDMAEALYDAGLRFVGEGVQHGN